MTFLHANQTEALADLGVHIDENPITVLMPVFPTVLNFANFELLWNRQAYATFGLFGLDT